MRSERSVRNEVVRAEAGDEGRGPDIAVGVIVAHREPPGLHSSRCGAQRVADEREIGDHCGVAWTLSAQSP
jgi:hypothetical protein